MGLARTKHQALVLPSGSDVSTIGPWGPDFGTPNGDALPIALDIGLDTLTTEYEGPGIVFDIGLETLDATFEGPGLVFDFGNVTLDADYVAGANTAVNDGPDNWTNQGNTTGLRNGVEASRAGQVAATTDANLHLTYANPSGGLEAFTISTVELRYDTRQTGTVLNNGGLHHEYRIGSSGAWTSLEVFAGNIDNNPKAYDITAAIAGSWTNINALEVRVRAVLGTATNLVTCFCDAVELRIVASKTITP